MVGILPRGMDPRLARDGGGSTNIREHSPRTALTPHPTAPLGRRCPLPPRRRQAKKAKAGAIARDEVTAECLTMGAALTAIRQRTLVPSYLRSLPGYIEVIESRENLQSDLHPLSLPNPRAKGKKSMKPYSV